MRYEITYNKENKIHIATSLDYPDKKGYGKTERDAVEELKIELEM